MSELQLNVQIFFPFIFIAGNFRCPLVPQAKVVCNACSQNAACKSWGQAFEPANKKQG